MLTNSSKALELAPNLAEAHASRGVALYVAGHPKEAIAVFEKAIALDSTLFEAHYFYGFCARDTGDFPSAAVHFEQASELQPANYQPLTLLSEIYLALGRPDRSPSAVVPTRARALPGHRHLRRGSGLERTPRSV